MSTIGVGTRSFSNLIVLVICFVFAVVPVAFAQFQPLPLPPPPDYKPSPNLSPLENLADAKVGWLRAKRDIAKKEIDRIKDNMKNYKSAGWEAAANARIKDLEGQVAKDEQLIADLLHKDAFDPKKNKKAGELAKIVKSNVQSWMQRLQVTVALKSKELDDPKKTPEEKKEASDAAIEAGKNQHDLEQDLKKAEEKHPELFKKLTMKDDSRSQKSALPAGLSPGSSVTAVTFTAVSGTTAIDRDLVGSVTSVSFVGVDQQEIPSDQVNAEVEELEGTVSVNLIDAQTAVSAIIVTGTAGSVVLFAKAATGAAPSAAHPLTLLGKSATIGNGNLVETLRTQPGVVSAAGDAVDRVTVQVADQLANVDALRDGEVAVRASRVPNATNGTEQVMLRTADGQEVASAIPAWSYNVSVQPVTAVNVWVPIMFQLAGLKASDTVTVKMTPGPGQEISPTLVTLKGNAAAAPKQIAQLRAQQVGPQTFQVEVTKKP